MRIRKPLRSDDVYEFTTLVSSAGDAPLPTSFRLEQNYPNPFNGETVIRYAVGPPTAGGGGRSHVRLRVYDMLGREVATLVDGPLAPGAYQARFAPGQFATGVYVYRLNVDGAFSGQEDALPQIVSAADNCSKIRAAMTPTSFCIALPSVKPQWPQELYYSSALQPGFLHRACRACGMCDKSVCQIIVRLLAAS